MAMMTMHSAAGMRIYLIYLGGDGRYLIFGPGWPAGLDVFKGEPDYLMARRCISFTPPSGLSVPTAL